MDREYIEFVSFCCGPAIFVWIEWGQELKNASAWCPRSDFACRMVGEKRPETYFLNIWRAEIRQPTPLR